MTFDGLLKRLDLRQRGVGFRRRDTDADGHLVLDAAVRMGCLAYTTRQNAAASRRRERVRLLQEVAVPRPDAETLPAHSDLDAAPSGLPGGSGLPRGCVPEEGLPAPFERDIGQRPIDRLLVPRVERAATGERGDLGEERRRALADGGRADRDVGAAGRREDFVGLRLAVSVLPADRTTSPTTGGDSGLRTRVVRGACDITPILGHRSPGARRQRGDGD
jgi:hypothetical protein